MKRGITVATLLVLVLAAGQALAQEKGSPAPLAKFVSVFTDPFATSAQKEVELPVGAWYEGTITVSDVDYASAKGGEPAHAEIRDWNYPGNCYLLIFRTGDTAGALKLRVGERVLVRAKLQNYGMNVTRFTVNCETRFAHFGETEILGPAVEKK